MFIGLPPLSIDGGPKGISIYQSATKQSISSVKQGVCDISEILWVEKKKNQVENSYFYMVY